jgi:DNA-binding HxlR family transcriptional regulator
MPVLALRPAVEEPPSRRGSQAMTAVSYARPPAQSATREARKQRAQDLDLIEHIDRTLDVLHGKWKVHLIFLMARGVHRHSRLLESLPGVSKKVMTDSLRAMESAGVVQRRVFAEVSPRVEYSLTPLGWTMTEPLIALSDWGAAHGDDVAEARRNYGFETAA